MDHVVSCMHCTIDTGVASNFAKSPQLPTVKQRLILEEAFAINPYPNNYRMQELMKQTEFSKK